MKGPTHIRSCGRREPEARGTRDEAGEEERAGQVFALCSFLQGTLSLLTNSKIPYIPSSLLPPAKITNQPCLSGTSSHPGHNA